MSCAPPPFATPCRLLFPNHPVTSLDSFTTTGRGGVGGGRVGGGRTLRNIKSKGPIVLDPDDHQPSTSGAGGSGGTKCC